MNWILNRVGLGVLGGGGWIAVAVLVGGAAASSAWVSWRVCEAGWLDKYTGQLEQAIADTKAQLADQYDRDRGLLVQQAKKQTQITRDERVALREVNRAKPDDRCADELLPAPVERVLNQARTGDVQHPEATAGAADQGGPAATNRDERAAHTQCATAYRRLAEQHNALVQWAETNLVENQR